MGPRRAPEYSAWLEIVQEEGAYFLLSFNSRGECLGDTWHSTLDEAKRQAKFQFGVPESAWEELPGP